MQKNTTKTARAKNAEKKSKPDLKEICKVEAQLNLKINNLSLEIMHLLKKYVNSACYVFSKNFVHITDDDLKQECYIKILSIVREKWGEEKTDLVELCKTSVYNLLKDIYRREKYRSNDNLFFTDDESDTIVDLISTAPDGGYDHTMFIDTIDMLANIEKRITGVDHEVLRMVIQPDMALIEIIQRNNRQAIKESQSGKLKMNIHQVKITSKSIAERLSISPATVSRSLKRINLIVSELLNDGESLISY